MTIQELFVAINNALLKSISQIRSEQWDKSMPPGTSTKPTKLIDAVRYHTYDDAWVPDVLAGKTKEEVGDSYETLLTNDNVQEEYAKYNKIASEAVEGFDELTMTTHLSYGDFSARDYLQHIISFRALRTYDIAKMIGADTTMPPELVQALWDEYSPVAEQYRAMGVFPPAVEVPEDASPQAKLMGLFGRN